MYDTLIQEINAYIKANANNEITGQGLNVILNSIVSALGTGANFYGIATPNTKPAENQYPKFYIAFTPGNYSNFNFSGAQPAFNSGFAILCDETGTNVWSMYVKNIKAGLTRFIIDAKIKNNVLSTNKLLYIKAAGRMANNSFFEIFEVDTDNNAEQLFTTFSEKTTLSGRKTHLVPVPQAPNMNLYVSVNWDELIVDYPERFTIEETRFPETAYIDNAEQLEIDSINSRLRLTEFISGFNADTELDLFTRTAVLTSSDTLSAYLVPSFINPETFTDAQNMPWSGSNKIMYSMDPVPSTTQRYILKLIPNNFPGQNIYYVYIPNISNIDDTITIETYDTATGSIVINSALYTIHANSILEVTVLIQQDIPDIHYSCREFVS